MKVLAFHIGTDRFGLALRDINRVLPVATLRALPGAPHFVAGLLDLHGQPIPVLDLNRLAGLPQGSLWADSRIVLVDYLADGGPARPLGLLAEHMLGTDTVADDSLVDAPTVQAPFLGRLGQTRHGSIQLLRVPHLLNDEVRAQLFPAEAT
jgi:chemotaxis-related protein WspB